MTGQLLHVGGIGKLVMVHLCVCDPKPALVDFATPSDHHRSSFRLSSI